MVERTSEKFHLGIASTLFLSSLFKTKELSHASVVTTLFGGSTRVSTNDHGLKT